MFCKECGREIPDGSKACMYCGAAVSGGGRFCPKCGAQASDGAAFCRECGSSLAGADGAQQQYNQQSAQQQYGQQEYQQQYGQQTAQQGYQQTGYQQQYQQPYSAAPDMTLKSRVTAGVLGILLGSLGIHNFYLGYTGKAVAQLLISVLSCGILAVASAIWGLVEGIMLLTGAIATDAQGRPLRD